jgi:hypothetical protein
MAAAFRGDYASLVRIGGSPLEADRGQGCDRVDRCRVHAEPGSRETVIIPRKIGFNVRITGLNVLYFKELNKLN